MATMQLATLKPKEHNCSETLFRMIDLPWAVICHLESSKSSFVMRNASYSLPLVGRQILGRQIVGRQIVGRTMSKHVSQNTPGCLQPRSYV